MANETVVKLGADASGYTAEIAKARTAGKAYIATQSEMAERTELAQAAIAEAVASGSNASVAAIKRYTDALVKSAALEGKSKAQKLELAAANLGLGDSVKPYIEQIAAASEHTEGFSLKTAAAKRELLVLGHELSQGNIKNFSSSLLVLAERTGAFTALLQPAVIGSAAFVAVFAVAAHAIIAAREELTTYGETIEKISKTTGLSTDDVQRFGFAASTVGVQTKDAADALDGLTKAQNEAQHGNKDAAAAFKAVGISMATLKSSSPDQVLAKVADAFAQSADGAGKAAVANELFGTSGKDLIPLLDQGSAHLTALGVTADSVGAVLSGNTIAQLSALKEQLELSTAKMDALTLSAKVALLPTIINLTNALSDNVALKPLLTDFYAGIAIIMKTAATAVATLVVGFEQTSEVIATLATVTGFAITGQFKLASAAAENGYDNLKKQGQGYSQFINNLWSNTTPGAAPHQSTATGQINFSKGNNEAPKPYQESRGDSLMDQAKQGQAVLQASLDGQEKLTGWAAKEVELRTQIDNLSGKTLTKAQQSILAHQTELLTQYAINADLEKQLDVRTRMDKLNNEAYDTNTKIQNQNDALADQHKTELAYLGQGTIERQRALDLLKIETDRQKELAEWSKKAETEKLTGTDQDTDERAAINKRYDQRGAEQKQFNAAQDVSKGDWMSGAKTGLQDIIDKTSDLATVANTTAQSAISNLGDAIATFATTGKLNIGDFAKSLIANFIKIESEALLAKAALSLFSFAGGGSVSTGSAVEGHATGGFISGPGSGTSDSIMARLSNGEFVMTADAVKRIGASNLDAMNAGASVHSMARFATGGIVGRSAASASSSGGGLTISPSITVEGGSSAAANQSNGDDLNKKITAAVRAVVVNERKQGGALWKMKNGIA